MKISNRHFFRFEGAEPAKQMFKEQLTAAKAYAATRTYEKSPDDPDRPENIENAAQQRPLPDTENPSQILSALSAFKPPLPETPPGPDAQPALHSEPRLAVPERESGRVVQGTA